MKRDTTALGDVAELEVALALMRVGKKVLRPLSAGLRYDLLVDGGASFTRVQCKSGLLRDGRIEFRLYSVSGHRTKGRSYAGDVDAFGVYCPANRRAYLVPISAVDGMHTTARLRVSDARNGQSRRIRRAIEFEIAPAAARLGAGAV